MSKTITIYTTNTCAYCVMVKKWLASKGLTYEEVNVEENPTRMAEMVELSGQMAVPVTIVTDADKDHRDVTIGWNPSKLASAVASMQPGSPQES